MMQIQRVRNSGSFALNALGRQLFFRLKLKEARSKCMSLWCYQQAKERDSRCKSIRWGHPTGGSLRTCLHQYRMVMACNGKQHGNSKHMLMDLLWSSSPIHCKKIATHLQSQMRWLSVPISNGHFIRIFISIVHHFLWKEWWFTQNKCEY